MFLRKSCIVIVVGIKKGWMKLENKLIVRRLISGILVLICALIAIYDSTFYLGSSNYDYLAKYAGKEAANISMMTGMAFVVFAIYLIIVGVVFISTSKRRPKKIIEYGIVIAWFGVTFIMGVISYRQFPGLLKNILTLSFIALVIGLPFKHGYKNMPFVGEDNRLPEKEVKTSGSIMSTSEGNQLIELKKLMDDGIITQEEFNAKKKKILGI